MANWCPCQPWPAKPFPSCAFTNAKPPSAIAPAVASVSMFRFIFVFFISLSAPVYSGLFDNCDRRWRRPVTIFSPSLGLSSSADFGKDLVWFPTVATPDLYNLPSGIDQRGGQSVGNGSTFVLAVDRERRSQVVDLFRVASGKTPDIRVLVGMRAVLFQDLGRVESGIQRDAE